MPNNDEFYHVLGLESGATQKEVKDAYKRLARQLHPDKNPDNPDAKEKFQQILFAYHKLTRHEHTCESDDEDVEYEFSEAEGIDADLFFSLLLNQYGGFAFRNPLEEPCNCARCRLRRKHQAQKAKKQTEQPQAFQKWQLVAEEITQSSIKLAWVPPSGMGKINTFVVFMDNSKIGGSHYKEIHKGKKRSHSVKSLNANHTYHFLVKALFTTGKSSYSNMASFRTIDYTKEEREAIKSSIRREKKKKKKEKKLAQETTSTSKKQTKTKLSKKAKAKLARHQAEKIKDNNNDNSKNGKSKSGYNNNNNKNNNNNNSTNNKKTNKQRKKHKNIPKKKLKT